MATSRHDERATRRTLRLNSETARARRVRQAQRTGIARVLGFGLGAVIGAIVLNVILLGAAVAVIVLVLQALGVI